MKNRSIARYAFAIVAAIALGFALGYFVMSEIREVQFQKYSAKHLTR